MKNFKNHDRGASLYVTRTRKGTFNLWEKNFMYGYDSKKIAENVTIEEIKEWRDSEYSGFSCKPSITTKNFEIVLIPHS